MGVRIYKMKSLAPLAICDDDGDWWIVRRKDLLRKQRKKCRYEMIEFADEVFQTFYADDPFSNTASQIERKYGLRASVWNFKIVIEDLTDE